MTKTEQSKSDELTKEQVKRMLSGSRFEWAPGDLEKIEQEDSDGM
jgi:hypothetical protein